MKKWLPKLPKPTNPIIVTSHPRPLMQRFCKVIYTDGSGGSQWYAKELEKLGWSAVQMDQKEVRKRLSTIEETGQHDIRQSDGVLWCSVCGHYTLKRQSRQFASVCTGVPRPSLAALKEGRHPVLGYAFRRTATAPAEVFALPAHSYSCRMRQYALQLCFGYDAASCSCMPGGVGARTGNPLSLP